MRCIRTATLLTAAPLLVAARIAHAQSAVARKPALVPVRGVVGGSDIVRTARRFVGVPYRLGGTTPRAFDCSGFVRYVFAKHGLALPRTAREQVAVGDAPPPGDSLEPGDLLFFWGGRGAQHIAIYVGHDSIIHASSSAHVVRLDRLARGTNAHRTWFDERLIAVRRVLPEDGVRYMAAGSSDMSLTSRVAPVW